MAGQPWYSLSLQLHAVIVTEILCPAMSQELVQDATDKVRGAVPAQKALMKLENVLTEHNKCKSELDDTKADNTSAIGKRTPKEENAILATGR